MPPAEPLSSDTSWQAKVHRPHQAERRQLVAQLLTHADATDDEYPVDQPHPSRKLANRLAHCCRFPEVMQDDASGELILTSDSCNSRVCPRCSRRRGAELHDRIDAMARMLDWPAMMTLTIRQGDRSLDEAIEHLQDSFKRLRRSKAWKAHVFGGVSVLEVKWSGANQAWHPHLHILCDMIYWPQAELSDAWLTASGDSKICDVRRVSGPKEAANYVTKYVSKGTDVHHMPSHRVPEWCHALHGRRLAQPFGALHGSRTRVQRPEHRGSLVRVGLLPILHEASHNGDETARELLTALLHRPRIDVSGTAAEPSGDDLAADRDLADSLRAWFESHGEPDHGTPASRSDPGPWPDRPHHRTKRLWEDPDPGPAAEQQPRHPDSAYAAGEPARQGSG